MARSPPCIIAQEHEDPHSVPWRNLPTKEVIDNSVDEFIMSEGQLVDCVSKMNTGG